MLNKIVKIFEEASKYRLEGKCPICHEIVDQKEFKDDRSLDEFMISGMCLTCQDKAFKSDWR